MKTPYTYLIGWKSLNCWYYGKRTGINCHPDELWKTYFTSSKYVKEFREIYGEPDVVEIRKVFDTEDACSNWEAKVLRRKNAKHDPKFLNRNNSSPYIGISGYTTVKNANGETLSVPIDDPRVISKELVGIRTGSGGWKHTQETKEKIRNSRTGKVRKKFSDEWRENMRLAHLGKSSGAKGKTWKWAEESPLKGVPRPKKRCPHCLNYVSITAINRYHTDNCKSRINLL